MRDSAVPSYDLDYDISSGQHGGAGSIIENIQFQSFWAGRNSGGLFQIKIWTRLVRHNTGLALLCEPGR